MNFDDFNITDNGDGTFTLAPKDPTTDFAELREEYKALRDEGLALLNHRNQVNTKLQALAARRDELKALLLTYGDPDSDETA